MSQVATMNDHQLTSDVKKICQLYKNGFHELMLIYLPEDRFNDAKAEISSRANTAFIGTFYKKLLSSFDEF